MKTNGTKGIDVSRYQGKIDWDKVAKNAEFAFIKATESTDWVDPVFSYNKREAGKAGLITGFYHFARGGDAKREANHFVKTVGELRDNLLVLDWEINHGEPDNWCREWLDEVKRLTGIKPLLYTNEARVKNINWQRTVAGDYGLWIARYYKNNGEISGPEPNSHEWPFWAFWQYTSRGRVPGIIGFVDLDYTTMDRKTILKYAGTKKEKSTIFKPTIDTENRNGYDWLDEVKSGRSVCYHPGRDYNRGYGNQDLGDPVFAIADGKVGYIGRDGGWGVHMYIRHDNVKHPTYGVIPRYWTHWAHLDELLVTTGDKVLGGQKIATVGKSGTTYAHLHLEIQKDKTVWGPTFYPWGKSKRWVENNYYPPDEFII